MLLADHNPGYLYRCKITDSAGNIAYSEPGMVCLDGLQITSQPEDFVGKVGDTVKFSITARGDGLTYQWQACGDGGSTWANAAACLTSRNFVAFIF